MLTAEYDYATDIAVQREEEREIALQEGMQQGENKRNVDIVLKMVSRGLDVKTISEYTDLDISEVKKIKDSSSFH